MGRRIVLSSGTYPPGEGKMKNVNEYAKQMVEGFERLAKVRTEEERIETWSSLAKIHAEAGRSYTESEIAAGIAEARMAVKS
jgi:head-tail adaptor